MGALELAQAGRGACAVAADPDEAATNREAARVVRFADEVFQHFPRLPVEQVDALRDLVADPETLR